MSQCCSSHDSQENVNSS